MKQAYLTIDDSPSSFMKEKVDILSARGIQALWFCRGDFIEQRPGHIEYAIEHGQIIGNHSYSHPHFSSIELKEAYDQIDHTDHLIDQIYDQLMITRPFKAFRFPYGDKGDLRFGDLSAPLTPEGEFRKQALQEHLKVLGYSQPAFEQVTHALHRAQHIFTDIDWRWTFDALEWKLLPRYAGSITIKEVLNRIGKDDPSIGNELLNPTTHELILIHDHEETHEHFSIILDKLLKMKIKFFSYITDHNSIYL